MNASCKHMIYVKELLLTLLCCLFLNSSNLHANETTIEELTAVYIFQISRLIEWPAEKASSKEFFICTLRNKRLTRQLSTLNNKIVNGKSIIIRTIDNLQSLGQCHLIYFDNSAVIDFTQMKENSQSHQVLTLSNQSNFVQQGGMIELYEHNSYLRFIINFEQTKKTSLKVSSKLLKLASKVI